MKFQTEIPLQKQPFNLLDYKSEIVLLGSCFAENISEKLDYYKFKHFSNPFGILFHPIAIEKLIQNAINEHIYTSEDVFFLNEQWHCFDAHSRLSDISQEVLLQNLNEHSKTLLKRLQMASHLVITLGTAWVYRYIETDTIVANCHKVPQKKFHKELLSVDEISQSLEATISLVNLINKSCKVLFTVSPVRHIKDGFVENTLSKAHLISAVHQIVEQNKSCFYFPSYEIMMDELRDYRFYKTDMLHPNELAISHIWESFCNVWMSSQALSTMEKVDQIQKALAHKPFNPNSDSHQAFLAKTQALIADVQAQFSHIVF